MMTTPRLDYMNYTPKKRRVLNSQSNLPDHEIAALMESVTKTSCHPPGAPTTPSTLSPEKPILPPCRVCDDKASGFHYGVNSCEACKGFFRRSLSSKVRYTCVGNGGCVINPTCRTCSYCRYQKCLDVGMSKHSIKIGRYTLEKKNRDIDEVNNLMKKNDPLSLSDTSINTPQSYDVSSPSVNETSPLNGIIASLPNSPVIPDFNSVILMQVTDSQAYEEISNALPKSPFTPHEQDGRKGFVSPNAFKKTENSGATAVCKNCERIRGGVVSTVTEGDPLCYTLEERDIIERISEANQLYNLYDNILQNLPELEMKQHQHYNELDMQSRMFGELRTLSTDEYRAFYRATGIDLEDRLTTVSEVSKLLEDGARRLIKFAKAIPRFKDLSFNDQASLIKASRFEYFLLGAFYGMNSDIEVGTLPDGRNYSLRQIAGVCDYNFTKHMFRFAEKLKSLHLRQDELGVLKGICLTFSDRVPLDNPLEVDSIQWTLMRCFISMLQHNHPDNVHLYTRVWDRLIELRSLNELNKKFTETLTMEWPEIAACPLILEILTRC